MGGQERRRDIDRIKKNKKDMSTVKDDLRYAESHEWVKLEGDIATVGISDYAQHALGDIVYVDMPEVGDEVEAGEVFGAVESVKAASDLLSPVSGTVEAVNEILEDAPESINADAYENWIMKVKVSDPAELEALLDAAAYAKLCENE
jgi:glycine cleavage system H protein